MSRDLVCRCRTRGDGLPFDPGRAFKRHRQSGWAPGLGMASGLSRRSLPLAVPPRCQPVDRAHVSGAGPINE